MAFNIPAQTSLALRRPTNPQPTWTRPVDWITITDAPNEVQFLYADTWPAIAINTTFTRPASQNIYIDWGDGVTDTISTTSNTITNHTYTPGTGTPCSRGYTTFKIRIYGDAGTVITNAIIGRPSTVNVGTPSGLLEAYYGDNVAITSIGDYFYSNYFGNPVGTAGSTGFFMFEFCKLPATYNGTSFSGIFLNCFCLAKIVMPTSMPNVNAMHQAFQQCYTLQSLTIPALPACTRIDTMVQNCFSLTSLTLPTSLPEVTEANSAFINCVSLTTLLVPEMPKCTSYPSTFSGCASLLQIKIPTWTSASSQTINIAGMFNACRSLANVIFPNTAASGTLFSGTSLFQNCSALVSAVLPSYWDTTSTNYFNGCSNLQSVVLPASMPNLTSLGTMFQNCNNLQNVTLPTTISASVLAMNNCFSGCSSLSKIDIPQSYNLGNLSNTFQNCSNLTSVTLPSGSQDNITTMAACFSGCSSLQTVVMPSSMNLLNTLNGTFQNCSNLLNLNLPSSLNAVTTMQNCFNGNTNLQTIKMPVSMSLCTTFTSTFQSCLSLQATSGSLDTFTMPAVVAASATYQAMFLQTRVLKNIVLPTTQTTTAPAASMTNTFSTGYGLKTITNVDKIGSTATNGTLLAGTTFANECLSLSGSLSFASRLSKLELQASVTNVNSLSSLRLTNTGGSQWTGTSPQINISYTGLSTAALNTLFADMAAQGSVTAKTINITGAAGAAGLTAGDRLVITSIGWTITG